MSWLYVPDTAVSNSDCTSQPAVRLAASATWSGKLRAPQFWSRKWKRDIWLQRLSGIASPRSTLAHGVESWTASLRASRANPPARPAKAKAQQTLVGFGPWYRVSSSRVVRPLSFSKTCQDCERKACAMCSRTLPRWGSMQNGVVSQRKRLAPRKAATASGSWPTATASSYGYNQGGGAGRVGKKRPSLAGAVKLWATVTVKGNHNVKGLSPNSGDGLGTQVRSWATVKSTDGDRPSGGNPSELRRNSPALPTQVQVWVRGPQDKRLHPLNGQKTSLSPRFVERKMGVPLGWVSASGCSETAWCLWWQQQHSVLWSAEFSPPSS